MRQHAAADRDASRRYTAPIANPESRHVPPPCRPRRRAGRRRHVCRPAGPGAPQASARRSSLR
ncbi:MAG: hypothetical protein MZV70_42845 [Desulfobacterales bacterium]|nr:hypothetical protein [Desulfobacterales bacterium]